MRMESREMIFQHVSAMLKVQAGLGVTPPIALAVTLTETRGLAIPDWRGFKVHEIIDDNLVLPEVIISDLSSRLDDFIRPVADLMWNAGGKEGSPNFDAEGKWSRPDR
jgi:hypothetical protein